MNNRQLKVLITGGSRGLGRKIADYLAKQGHGVSVIDIAAKSDTEASYLSALEGYYECDLSNTHAIEDTFTSIINKAGKIDLLINNAAIREFKKLEEFKPEEIERNINVDFIAPVILSNLCLPLMKKNKFGRIINISSISAYRVYCNGSLYCSSKRALIAFTEALGKELSDLNGTVTVNTICPDSFSRIDGTGLKDGQWITQAILGKIDNIIESRLNGKAINIFTLRHKISERLYYFRRAFFMD